MELLLCAPHYCNCFPYVDSCNALKHMAGFFVYMDTILEGICTDSDDLKLWASVWEGNWDIGKWDLGDKPVTALKVWETEVDLNSGQRQGC